MVADIDLGRCPPVGGSDSGTRIEISQPTEGIQGCPFLWRYLWMLPILCPNLVEIGQVVLEI